MTPKTFKLTSNHKNHATKYILFLLKIFFVLTHETLVLKNPKILNQPRFSKSFSHSFIIMFSPTYFFRPKTHLKLIEFDFDKISKNYYTFQYVLGST